MVPFWVGVRPTTGHGAGLSRLQVSHGTLIETSSRQYPRTALWGQALYDCGQEFDGLIWRSRQFNDSYALMLWAGRIQRFEQLKVDPSHSPLPLYLGEGLQSVQHHADDCGITVIQ
ncbi:hypothetical protein B1T44_29750 [Mycobacterium persicum]|nr:hypothetical protein B1T44_29750 [Mycobacterium persicum]